MQLELLMKCCPIIDFIQAQRQFYTCHINELYKFLCFSGQFEARCIFYFFNIIPVKLGMQPPFVQALFCSDSQRRFRINRRLPQVTSIFNNKWKWSRVLDLFILRSLQLSPQILMIKMKTGLHVGESTGHFRLDTLINCMNQAMRLPLINTSFTPNNHKLTIFMSIIRITGDLRRCLTMRKENIMIIFKKEKKDFDHYKLVSLF